MHQPQGYIQLSNKQNEQLSGTLCSPHQLTARRGTAARCNCSKVHLFSKLIWVIQWPSQLRIHRVRFEKPFQLEVTALELWRAELPAPVMQLWSHQTLTFWNDFKATYKLDESDTLKWLMITTLVFFSSAVPRKTNSKSAAFMMMTVTYPTSAPLCNTRDFHERWAVTRIMHYAGQSYTEGCRRRRKWADMYVCMCVCVYVCRCVCAYARRRGLDVYCCSVLQCVEVCCRAVALCCSVLQCELQMPPWQLEGLLPPGSSNGNLPKRWPPPKGGDSQQILKKLYWTFATFSSQDTANRIGCHYAGPCDGGLIGVRMGL